MYETNGRTKTPPPAPVKGIDKARPQSVRATDLKATPESADFVDLEDDEEDDDLDLPPVYKGPVSKRASTTTRQLTQKRLRDQSNPLQEYYREQLFTLTRCRRDGCTNGFGKGTSNCFHLTSKDTHHKLTSSELT